ncbi:MAG TPA: alpha-L-fucosidase [Bacillota bacterium]|nr:alpha-L-fucosidase [Bacillota bacterium]
MLATLLLGGLKLNAADSKAATGESLPKFPPVQPQAMQNWQDKRFGMFIHWGPVSLTAREIGWSRGDQTPIEVYDNLYKQFNPTNFNADAWVKVAKDAGMKYIVLTTKHHDGFCLWDTKQTDFNIMNSPFHRDVVKELSAACKQAGIAFGTYYSTCDWHHPEFPFTSPGGKVKREKFDLDAYNRYLLAQVSELITNYGPLITIWNDVPQMFEGRGVNTIKLVRQLQPDITINNRTGDGGDYETPEQRIGGFNLARPWESCMTISAHNHWAWGGANDGVKSLAACLMMLISGAGGDGNVLLNVGPRPDGMIDPEQAARLKEVGDWLAQYGESIYGTRGGPFKPGKWGASTRKGNRIYVHVFKFNGEQLDLPAIPAKITAARVLTGGSVHCKQTDTGIRLAVPAATQAPMDTLIALDLDKPAMDLPPLRLTSGADSLALGAKARASNVFQKQRQYDADKAVDDDLETRWATDSGTKHAWLELDLGKPQTFSKVALHEWEGDGQRIQKFEFQFKNGADWKTLFTGSTMGHDFKQSFPAVTARFVRLNILEAREGPTIDEVELLK